MFRVSTAWWQTDTPHVSMGYAVWLETMNEIADWWGQARSTVHIVYNPQTRQHEKYVPRNPYSAVRARVAPVIADELEARFAMDAPPKN